MYVLVDGPWWSMALLREFGRNYPLAAWKSGGTGIESANQV